MAMSLRYSTIVISWEDFMNEFVPEPDISKPEYPFDTFSPFSGPRCEEGFLVSLTEAVNHRDLCPGYTFLHSSRNNANQYCDNGKPACYGMVRKGEPSTNLYEPIDWSNVEVPIECRAAEPNEDPFSEQRPNMQMHAENQEDSLHQIFWFIHEIFARQHRVFLFAVFILGPHARVLRADRSGIFSTEWINCTTAGGRLAEFFWRVSCLSPAERGHDPTAERVLYDSPYANMLKAAERALDKNDYLHSLFKTTLDPNWPWWLLRFEDEGARKLRTFVVGKPHFVSSDIVGSGTRGFIALDVERPTGPLVYLKDTWRVIRGDIGKEGTTLGKLNAGNVPHVPTLEAHGDLDGQTTISQNLWFKYCSSMSCDVLRPLTKRAHYRIVVREVGKPLTEIVSGYDLILALYCCLKAHWDAYDLGIIHRDISVENVLLYPSKKSCPIEDQPQVFQGILTGWELSKDMSKPPVGRQPERSATWQFASAHSLSNREKTIEIQDELESVFYVLLYVAIRFLPHNCDEGNVDHLLLSYFDDYQATNSGSGCGLQKFYSMRNGEISFLQKRNWVKLRFLYLSGSERAHPINDIVGELFCWFKSHYALTFHSHDAGEPVAGTSSQGLEPSNTRVPRVLQDDEWAARRYAMAYQKSGVAQEAALISLHTMKTDVNKANAAKLADHFSIVALFGEYLDETRHEWPVDDKTKDKLSNCAYSRVQDTQPADVRQPSTRVIVNQT